MSGTWSCELPHALPTPSRCGLLEQKTEVETNETLRISKRSIISFGFFPSLGCQSLLPAPILSLEIKLSFQKLVIFNGLIE